MSPDASRAARLAILLCVIAVSPSVAGQDPTVQSGATPILFDRDMTVGAGVTISLAAAEALAAAERQVIPVRLFEERGGGRRTANIAYRVFKLSYFDLPQEDWLHVVNHEVFGHGARLRELFDGSIGYSIDAPSPYGDGGGATFFSFDREPTFTEVLAISAGGMEASTVGAEMMASRAFATGQMDAREAMRYLRYELDPMRYILSTGDTPEEAGHDVSDHLETYNELARLVGAREVTARTLRRESLLNLANPMLAFAAIGIGLHLWNGTDDVRIPTLSIGGMRYLPLMRYRLTPFGTEVAISNAFTGGRLRLPPTQVDVRIGRAPGSTPWGLGVHQRGVASWQNWRVDVAVDAWRQPDSGAGVEVRGRVERPLIPVWFGSRRASVLVEIGVKSEGYVPGEPLGSGVNVRAGVGLPLTRTRGR